MLISEEFRMHLLGWSEHSRAFMMAGERRMTGNTRPGGIYAIP